MKSALIVGATGLVGGFSLENLLASNSYQKVIALVRTPLATAHSKLESHVIDFDHLQQSSHLIRADDIFCALGTTIKKAGSQAAFEKVDYTYPFEVAKIALANGAKQFILVSALGTAQNSKIFYARVKWKTEQAILILPFRAVHILRPSFIIGKRTESRLGEHAAIVLARLISPLLLGRWKKYRPIHARTIAKAMVILALQGSNGVHIYESDGIQNIADAKR